MPAGDAFTEGQRADIERALRLARETSGRHFSVFVGSCEGESRPFARRLHAALDDPDHSVLVLVDPPGRRVEVVTGAQVRQTLEDAACGLAALGMQSAFAAGDLVGGICAGVNQLAEHARGFQSLHTDTPH